MTGPLEDSRNPISHAAPPDVPRAAVAHWLLAMGGFAALLASFIYWNSTTTTTIVLVRHAEKQLGAISDAPLSPAGEHARRRASRRCSAMQSLSAASRGST